MIRMKQTWFRAGVPEYEAGKEYDLDPGLELRMVRRKVAERVTHKEQPVNHVPARPSATPPSPENPAQTVRKKKRRKKT